MTKEQELEQLLKSLDESLMPVSDDEEETVGKDLNIMARELTNDRNVYRFGYLKMRDVGRKALGILAGMFPQFVPQENGIRPRYVMLSMYNSLEMTLRQCVSDRHTGNMADRYKDLGGYLLAYRGGIEWRSAGVAGGLMMMEQEKKGILGKLKGEK